MIKWRVTRTGSGAATYDHVRVVEGGVLECLNREPGRLGDVVPAVVAYYGPGMWVTALKVDQ
jgi:hypothetical protein